MQPAVDPLSATLSALADPTRRAILARLSQGEATVGELAAPFDISLPAVSRHLKVLETAGLITRGREAQWRPCRLEAGPLKDLAGWLERSGVRHVVYSSCNAESLARDLAQMPSLRPVEARILDMFPHTTHYEVMVLLAR